jgi:hypothetical protein
MSQLFEGDGLTPILHLQKMLFDEYGSPDRRVKKFEKVKRFRVDGCQLATGADGHPLSSVCVIWATVKAESDIEVHLSGSIPLDGAVAEWIRTDGKTIVKDQKHALALSLRPGEQTKLSTLAIAMNTRAASRRPYVYASHGYSALEIARSLERLHHVLDIIWK